MEKKKNIKVRFLSGLLAMIVAGGNATPLALAEEKEHNEKNVKIISLNESLNNVVNEQLDTKYMDYLLQNGIEVVDGNIVISNIEQFTAVKEYYKKYFDDNNHFVNNCSYYMFDCEQYITSVIFFINYNNLNDELKQEILSKKMVCLDNGVIEMVMSFMIDSCYYNESRISEGYTDIILAKDICFDANLRKIQSMLETDLISVANSISEKNTDSIFKNIGDKYLTYFYDEGTNYFPPFANFSGIEKSLILTTFNSILNLLIANNYEYSGFLSSMLSDASNECYSELNEIIQNTSALLPKNKVLSKNEI